MCTKQVHELLIHNDNAVNCIFCNKQIQDQSKLQRYVCCSNMSLVKDIHLVCKNCGQVHDYLIANEYVDFYEKRDRLKKKSVYHRKYHILNVMYDIAQKYSIQYRCDTREKILRIFRLIDQVSFGVNIGRKRLIRVNYILKRLFDILEIEYKFIPITKSRRTL